MNDVSKNFERDTGVLRGIIKSSGYETDPYKIIILVERYILEYGTIITQKTVNFLLNKDVKAEDRQKALLDILQTQKTPEQLHLNNYNNGLLNEPFPFAQSKE